MLKMMPVSSRHHVTCPHLRHTLEASFIQCRELGKLKSNAHQDFEEIDHNLKAVIFLS